MNNTHDAENTYIDITAIGVTRRAPIPESLSAKRDYRDSFSFFLMRRVLWKIFVLFYRCEMFYMTNRFAF